MADVEHGTAVEGGRSGISRRDALKKGAVAGGAVLWVSPIVQNIGISKAWAAHTSVPAHGVSFVAFRFTCNGTTYFAKLEGFSTGDPDGTCEGANNSSTGNCTVSDANATNACGSGLFTVATVFNQNGEAIQVVVTLTCGTFDDAGTKCGTAHGGCHDGAISGGGNVATFICPD